METRTSDSCTRTPRKQTVILVPVFPVTVANSFPIVAAGTKFFAGGPVESRRVRTFGHVRYYYFYKFYVYFFIFFFIIYLFMLVFFLSIFSARSPTIYYRFNPAAGSSGLPAERSFGFISFPTSFANKHTHRTI